MEPNDLWLDTAIDDDSGPYTGVLFVHGIGDEKRNDMLQEALNSLLYWFNHVAGLALRPHGDGRIWLHTHLTDDDDPDSPASRALIELVPPAPAGAAHPEYEEGGLHIKLREVWWAKSFGLPSTHAAMRWALVQWWQEAPRMLFPFSAARTARAAAPGAARGSSAGSRLTALVLRPLLAVYDLLQYLSKVLQWLVATPLLMLVLLLAGMVQMLAPLPGVKTLLRSVAALVDYVSLHWIASMQVYLLDYTRSASIRHRLDREIRAYLRDERCHRIVVIAHSMGTVVAYEGLTTALAGPTAHTHEKPVSFICLAQALRRIWLLARTDPHRLRGVLPDYVTWTHYWARYDPVAAGPLTPRALPRLRDWRDRRQPDPTARLAASLERVVNRRVVNGDSLMTDHLTYWQNLEQVVGPIAAELVAGHPELEQLVAAHLATSAAVVKRRWRVAWRTSLALIGGYALGFGAFLLGMHYALGPNVRQTAGDWLANGHNLPSFLGLLWGLAAGMIGSAGTWVYSAVTGVIGASTYQQLAGQLGRLTDGAVTVIVALIVAAVAAKLILALVGPRSPFVFTGPRDRVRVPGLDPFGGATGGAGQSLGQGEAVSAVAVRDGMESPAGGV
ncbi:MAG: hypothetical protein ACHQ4H_00370 [Ktedonobacterales bacterium]